MSNTTAWLYGNWLPGELIKYYGIELSKKWIMEFIENQDITNLV